MTKPVKTSERRPTEDDADEAQRVWAWSANDRKWISITIDLLSDAIRLTHWAPKAKAVPPEPIREERREMWVNKYVWNSGVGFAYDTKPTADANACTQRIECIHVREVLPGDPTSEQIEEAMIVLRRMINQFPHMTIDEAEKRMAAISSLLNGQS